MPTAPNGGPSPVGLPARAVCGVAAAGSVGLAVGTQPASAGVLGGLLPRLVFLAAPIPRPPGGDDVGACGMAAAGFVGLAGGRAPPPRLMLNPPGRVGVGGVAAAGGIMTVGRAQRRPGHIQGGVYDGCVEGASRGGHAAGRAG